MRTRRCRSRRPRPRVGGLIGANQPECRPQALARGHLDASGQGAVTEIDPVLGLHPARGIAVVGLLGPDRQVARTVEDSVFRQVLFDSGVPAGADHGLQRFGSGGAPLGRWNSRPGKSRNSARGAGALRRRATVRPRVPGRSLRPKPGFRRRLVPWCPAGPPARAVDVDSGGEGRPTSEGRAALVDRGAEVIGRGRRRTSAVSH